MSQQLFGDALQFCAMPEQPLTSAYVVPHPTRPNEDTFCICPLWFGGLGLVSFFGVYDGHSGSEVSRFLASSLHHYVEACGMVAPDAATALCRAFQSADAALEEATLNCPDAGSTATVALLSGANIIVAHCGDSRALLCRGDHVIALTEDHRPARLDERARVLGSGGQILWNEGERVMGVLATTRAFGDRDLKQFGVTAEPEVTIVSRSPDDEFLILATDGVFNVLTNDEAADVARRVVRRALERGSPRAAAIRLAASAIGRFSRDRNSKDDITVVVVDLAPGSSGPAGSDVQRDAAAAEILSRAADKAGALQQQHQPQQAQAQVQQQARQRLYSGAAHHQQQQAQQPPSMCSCSSSSCSSPSSCYVTRGWGQHSPTALGSPEGSPPQQLRCQGSGLLEVAAQVQAAAPKPAPAAAGGGAAAAAGAAGPIGAPMAPNCGQQIGSTGASAGSSPSHGSQACAG